MQKTEQKKLLWMSGTAEIAYSLVGIFFLFFVKENFGLTLWQTVAWFAVLQLFFGILVYPLNHWGLKKMGVVRMIGLGLLAEIGFFVALGLGWSSTRALAFVTMLSVIEMALFWPSYNFMTALATKNESRGDFLGNLKVVMVTTGVIAPVFVGWLFDMGWQNKVLWLVVLFSLVTIHLSQQLKVTTHIPPLQYASSLAHLKRVFLDKDRFWGFFPDITNSVMWVIWPLYFQWVVGKFVIMGAITSFAAVVEMVTSKVLGKITDRKSAQKLLQTTVWARVIDLFLRSLYLIFSPTWFVGLIQGLGAILGPLYQIPYTTRLMEVGEEQNRPEDLFDYWVIREVYLGIGRGVFLSLCAGLMYLFGPWFMAILIAVAGLTALGARKL